MALYYDFVEKCVRSLPAEICVVGSFLVHHCWCCWPAACDCLLVVGFVVACLALRCAVSLRVVLAPSAGRLVRAEPLVLCLLCAYRRTGPRRCCSRPTSRRAASISPRVHHLPSSACDLLCRCVACAVRWDGVCAASGPPSCGSYWPVWMLQLALLRLLVASALCGSGFHRCAGPYIAAFVFSAPCSGLGGADGLPRERRDVHPPRGTHRAVRSFV